jgi:hypothetical protein
MPTFTIDVSNYAQEYVADSIKDKGGNPGQEALIEALDIDCTATVEVYIAGDQVETTADGRIQFTSNHPDAIEIILAEAEDTFDEFISRLGSESSSAYNGLDIIQTIRQIAVDEAFRSL